MGGFSRRKSKMFEMKNLLRSFFYIIMKIDKLKKSEIYLNFSTKEYKYSKKTILLN